MPGGSDSSEADPETPPEQDPCGVLDTSQGSRTGETPGCGAVAVSDPKGVAQRDRYEVRAKDLVATLAPLRGAGERDWPPFPGCRSASPGASVCDPSGIVLAPTDQAAGEPT